MSREVDFSMLRCSRCRESNQGVHRVAVSIRPTCAVFLKLLDHRAPSGDYSSLEVDSIRLGLETDQEAALCLSCAKAVDVKTTASPEAVDETIALFNQGREFHLTRDEWIEMLERGESIKHFQFGPPDHPNERVKVIVVPPKKERSRRLDLQHA